MRIALSSHHILTLIDTIDESFRQTQLTTNVHCATFDSLKERPGGQKARIILLSIYHHHQHPLHCHPSYCHSFIPLIFWHCFSFDGLLNLRFFTPFASTCIPNFLSVLKERPRTWSFVSLLFSNVLIGPKIDCIETTILIIMIMAILGFLS